MEDFFLSLMRYSLVGMAVSIGGLIYSFVKKSRDDQNLRLELATRIAFFCTLMLSGGVFIFSIAGMDSQKHVYPMNPPILAENQAPKRIDSRREVFQAWAANLKSNLEIFDARWQNLWIEPFDGLQAGSITINTVYHDTEILQIEMERLRERIHHATPPSQLTKSQQKKLQHALEDLDEMIKLRLEACEDFQKLVKKDKLTPARLDKIRGNLYRSNECIQRAGENIAEVSRELGM